MVTAVATTTPVAVVLVSVPSQAPAMTGTREKAAVPVLRWTGCGGGFECTTATVPLDYDHPTGRTIELALLRRPADDQAHKIGSVFVNPGGPGGSGVDFVAEFGQDLFSDQVRARFDVIGFDPRGVGRSKPLRCFRTGDEALEAFSTPYEFPVKRAEENVWIAADRRVARACADRHPAILDHMATADVARDLDLLRRAVGDRGLTYWGISYGSILGATYANLFPGKVRALALDGVADPVAWFTGRFGIGHVVPAFNRVGASRGSFATLEQFFALCDAGGPRCALSKGSPRHRFEALAAKLRVRPVVIDVDGSPFEFGYDELVSITLDFLYQPDEWPELAEGIRDVEAAVAARTPAAAHAVARVPAFGTRLSAARAAAQEPYPNEVDAEPGVTCSDTDNPSHVAAWRVVARVSDVLSPYFGRPWTWLTSICQQWPGNDADRYTGPFTAKTANPVFLVNPRYDPATPYRGARAVARLMPNARLLTVNGWGHTSFFAGSACAHRAVSRYLLQVVVPARGTVCGVDHVPFTAQNTAASAARRSEAARTFLIPSALRRAMAS